MASADWADRYLQLASFVSQWSKDPKAKVGAVLLDRNNWVVALGYNGFPKGVEDNIEKLKNEKDKNNMVVHAEQNALICAGPRADGGSIYVFKKPVCSRCAVLIIQAGIKKVVALKPDPENNKGEDGEPSDSHTSGIISVAMFREAGICLELIEEKEMNDKVNGWKEDWMKET
ncbi:MAG: deoxycytidylate deaminase [Nitrospirae bacterium]|nr:deoxycytidylate deaminase [Magnetococcales bacterium]HAT49462.1 deoxycytidylate deaminase [Alphaproteobacteria bacterium]